MEKQMARRIFTVEGTIQALKLAPGVANLIEDLQKGSYFTGVIAGLGGEAGVLANSASLAMYDGEDVEHIALLLNGMLAVGTFEWLRELKVGDEVNLVVSEIHDGPLFVHAILRKNDQLLWTPISVDHTRRGWIVHAAKLGGLILSFTWLMCGLCFLTSKGSSLNTMDLMIVVLFPLILIAFVMFMSTRGVMHFGKEAEDIFQALGVPEFERFKIKPYSFLKRHLFDDIDASKKGHIFYFSEALSAHKKRFRLS
jgi:hypothetical protein